jgi:hypothetical protein
MSTEPILELIRENLIALKKFWETEIEVKKIMADIRLSMQRWKYLALFE